MLQDAPGAKAVLIATGSEVGLAVAAAAKLASAGAPVRVVSMPCLERFLAQDSAYQASVLPAGSKRCSIEAGRTGPWKMLTGLEGLNLGVDSFGESAPYEQVYDHFGLSPDKVVSSVQAWLAR